LVEANGIVWEITLPLPIASDAISRHSAAALKSQSLRPRIVQDAPGRLTGKRFLVVEDEPLVALDIVSGLEEAGAEVAGQAGSVAEALLIVESASFDGALVDGNLRGERVDNIAAALTRRQVPFLFVTGYGSECLPRGFGKPIILSKPFSQQKLVEAAHG
jgi:CheY-like chemotaxis protein